MPLLIQNFILFQVGWLCAVLSGANQLPTIAAIGIVAFIVAVHLLRASDSNREISLIVLTLIIGATWDSSLMVAGIFTFHTPTLLPVMAPLWLIAMWALFATTINVSLRWLKGRYWLAALLGGIGGPLAYFAGHRLGAVTFSDTATAMTAVAAGWAIIMPLLVLLAERYNGYAEINESMQEAKTA
jgi:hypothetical protein